MAFGPVREKIKMDYPILDNGTLDIPDTSKLYSCIERLKSFQVSKKIQNRIYSWPFKVIPPEALSQLGFFYFPLFINDEPRKDCIGCIYCKKTLFGLKSCRDKKHQVMETLINVMNYHLQDNLTCMMTNINLKILEFISKKYEWNPKKLFNNPHNEVAFNYRLLSFKNNWIHEDQMHINSQSMANSGLIRYDQNVLGKNKATLKKLSDGVYCLYCNNILENWKVSDDPLIEHYKLCNDGQCYFFETMTDQKLKKIKLSAFNDPTYENKKYGDYLEIWTDQLTFLNQNLLEEESKKKKRGRPKKYSTESNSQLNLESQEPKKRGRPRKIVLKDTDKLIIGNSPDALSISNIENENQEIQLDNCIFPKNNIKRPRGRPKKGNLVNNNIVDIVESLKESNHSTLKADYTFKSKHSQGKFFGNSETNNVPSNFTESDSLDSGGYIGEIHNDSNVNRNLIIKNPDIDEMLKIDNKYNVKASDTNHIIPKNMELINEFKPLLHNDIRIRDHIASKEREQLEADSIQSSSMIGDNYSSKTNNSIKETHGGENLVLNNPLQSDYRASQLMNKTNINIHKNNFLGVPSRDSEIPMKTHQETLPSVRKRKKLNSNFSKILGTDDDLYNNLSNDMAASHNNSDKSIIVNLNPRSKKNMSKIRPRKNILLDNSSDTFSFSNQGVNDFIIPVEVFKSPQKSLKKESSQQEPPITLENLKQNVVNHQSKIFTKSLDNIDMNIDISDDSDEEGLSQSTSLNSLKSSRHTSPSSKLDKIKQNSFAGLNSLAPDYSNYCEENTYANKNVEKLSNGSSLNFDEAHLQEQGTPDSSIPEVNRETSSAYGTNIPSIVETSNQKEEPFSKYSIVSSKSNGESSFSGNNSDISNLNEKLINWKALDPLKLEKIDEDRILLNDYFHEVLNLINEHNLSLSNDKSGHLEYFIQQIPKTELQMTFSQWIDYKVRQVKLEFQAGIQEKKSVITEQFNKAQSTIDNIHDKRLLQEIAKKYSITY